MALTLDTTVRRAPDLVWERLGEATLVLDAARGRYVRLNATGGELWNALAEPARVAELAAALTERRAVDREQAEADALAFVASLQERGLIEAISG